MPNYLGTSQPPIEIFHFAAWHEDFGDVLWFHYPIVEAPWVGTPLDTNFDSEWHTWWMKLPDGNRVHEIIERKIKK